MVDTLLPALVCLTLMSALAGNAIAQDSSLPTIEPAAPTAEDASDPAKPTVAERAMEESREVFVLKLTAVREKVVPAPPNDQPTDLFEKKSTTDARGTTRASNPFAPPGSATFPEPSYHVTAVETKTRHVTEEIQLFCEDLQVTAKVVEHGNVNYTITCQGHIRIKTATTEIVGQNATYANGLFKLESARITTGDTVLTTSDATFEFPLSALQVQKISDALPEPEPVGSPFTDRDEFTF